MYLVSSLLQLAFGYLFYYQSNNIKSMFLMMNFYLKDEDKNTFYFLNNIIWPYKLKIFSHIGTPFYLKF